MKIFIDGKLYDKEEAKVSVFDHGLLYGDGVFEGIRAYNGRVFMLDEHVARLFESAKGILLQPVWTPEEVSEAILSTLRANGLKDAYIRVVMTRGAGDLGLDMRRCKRPSLIIITGEIALYPEVYYKKGLDVITSSLRRPGHDILPPAIKSLNYLNNILARAEATRANAQEALLLNAAGFVAECSGDNIFKVCNKRVVTPPCSAGILEGITRLVVMRLVREKFRMEMEEQLFAPFDLYRAGEVFLTGTGAEVVPVVRVDGRAIGNGQPGPFTQKLIEAFREYVATHGTPIYEEAKVK
jgi:branched-chain amino acid aminotransferase